MISFALAFGRLYRILRMGVRDAEFRALLTAVLSLLTAGVIFYMVQEGWSFVDALYFCVTTLTTVGFGDPAPSSDLSTLFTIVYVIVGIGLIASFIAAIAERSREIVTEKQKREGRGGSS
jgi:voltage-gated potassium channel